MLGSSLIMIDLFKFLLILQKTASSLQKMEPLHCEGKRAIKKPLLKLKIQGSVLIPKEVENIWHRFYKADLSRTTNPYGEFGLGLSIVKQLVQLHYGEIEVSSEKEKGTKFVIRFPIQHRQD